LKEDGITEDEEEDGDFDAETLPPDDDGEDDIDDMDESESPLKRPRLESHQAPGEAPFTL